MARYIELNAAVAEVERRISSLHPKGGQGIVVTKILKDHYKDYLSFLNTLEAKEVQEEPVSKNLEEASKKWLRPQLDKSYAAYGLLRQMELTHFDGYAMLDAIEFGAKWKEEQFEKEHTKKCSNIEYEQDVYPPACQPWFTPDQAKKAVEIARGEMINKLRKWVSSKNERDSFTFGYIDRHFDELLKQAMKDE